MRRAVLCLAFSTALAAGAAAAQGPSFAVGRDGVLRVGGLPDILTRPEVRPHLATGLTTTFVLRVTATDAAGTRIRGGGRIDVRWEPWDEVFLTTALGVDGQARKDSSPSFDRLVAWWQALDVPAAGGLSPGGRWSVKVDLSVIPFSASEQRDTQRWFSDSLGQRSAPPTGAQAAPVAPADPNAVLDLLIATSIKRRSLASYSWTAAPRTAPERRKGGAA
jgi:hypothetical protein